MINELIVLREIREWVEHWLNTSACKDHNVTDVFANKMHELLDKLEIEKTDDC